jgi:hypothetical protein
LTGRARAKHAEAEGARATGGLARLAHSSTLPAASSRGRPKTAGGTSARPSTAQAGAARKAGAPAVAAAGSDAHPETLG